jgi:hypothetical protein
MPEEDPKVPNLPNAPSSPFATPPPPEAEPSGEGETRDRFDRGISDFVRRAVSAGIEAASRGKSDIVRVATTEVRSWLDKLDLDTEIVKALSRMTLEVKAEIRFRPAADGKVTPDVVGDMKIKGPSKG